MRLGSAWDFPTESHPIRETEAVPTAAKRDLEMLGKSQPNPTGSGQVGIFVARPKPSQPYPDRNAGWAPAVSKRKVVELRGKDERMRLDEYYTMVSKFLTLGQHLT